MPDASVDSVLQWYPSLTEVPVGSLEADLARMPMIEVADGVTLFREKDLCAGFPMVLAGRVRVSRMTPQGKALALYRVDPGEICVVSTSCLLRATPMTAQGSTQGNTRLLLVDQDTLNRWTAYPAFRSYLFGLMAERLSDLMTLVEAVAFQRVDRRLASALLGHGPLVRTTHQQLADELGTAREMVSRLLKRFEERGLVALGREQIEILDAAALRALASAD